MAILNVQVIRKLKWRKAPVRERSRRLKSRRNPSRLFARPCREDQAKPSSARRGLRNDFPVERNPRLAWR